MSSTVIIPPMPVGDAGGMRELASICRNVAGVLGPIGDDVTGLPKQMTFEGPAADTFQGRMQALGSRISAGAHELQDHAGRLESAAAEVERLIAERNAALQRLAEEQRLAAMKVPP